MLGLILFGWISYSRLGVSQMPDVDLPLVTIDISYEGASPEIVETDVIDLVEEAVISVEGVTQISSSARQGAASITVELSLDRDVDVAVQEIQSKLSRIQGMLPDDIDPPIISKKNPEDSSLIIFTLSSTAPLKEQMLFVKNHIKDRFQTVAGVGEVRLYGYVDRNIRIWVDRKRLQKYELTVDDVINAIGREHVEIPGGNLDTGKQEIVIRSIGETMSVESMGQIPVTARGGTPVYRKILLRDVANIEDGLDEIKRISRFNQKASIGIGIFKQRGANAIQIVDESIKRAEEIKKILPKGYELNISHNWTNYIKESNDELIFTILLSTILTGFVCFIFLGSWTSTFNIILAVPTSLMGTFLFLYFFGFTLNTFTLLALTLAIGIVVDDAIMVMENISRHMELGENRVEASRKGAKEITFAALAATLAVVAIFLPVAFMSGVIGKYFLQFGIAITVAVLLSLVEALTLTPMRCSRFMRESRSEGKIAGVVNRYFSKLAGFYSRLLAAALQNRMKVIALSLVLFALLALLIKPIKKEFVPDQDQGIFILSIRMPSGSSLEYTNSAMKKVEAYLATRKEIARQYVAVGGGGSGGVANLGIIICSMHDPDKRPINKKKGRSLNQNELINSLRPNIKKISREMKVSVRTVKLRGLTSSRGYPVEFVVKGRDWKKLTEYCAAIEEKMKKSGKVVDIDSNYDIGQPEIHIIPDRIEAEKRGVSMASIGNTISALIGGKKIGKFTENGHRYDIRIRLKDDERRTESDINRLYVRNNRGELVKLSDVVKMKKELSLLSISRLNRERAITVYANPAPGYSQLEAVDAALKLARETLPEGYYAEITGSAKTTSESFDSLIFALVVGIVVSYMILASQFNSYLHPFIILLSLPFSFSGAIAALYVFGQSINIFSFIGLILLMGLVKKNSILLVEFTNQVREREGMGVKDALLTACPIRLRPILMTTLSTIAASIPPAMALGPGAETRIPMAVAVLGGMTFSTLLTLFVVPCAYSLLSRWERKEYYS